MWTLMLCHCKEFPLLILYLALSCHTKTWYFPSPVSRLESDVISLPGHLSFSAPEGAGVPISAPGYLRCLGLNLNLYIWDEHINYSATQVSISFCSTISAFKFSAAPICLISKLQFKQLLKLESRTFWTESTPFYFVFFCFLFFLT